MTVIEEIAAERRRQVARLPYTPTPDEWSALYAMLCEFCDRQLRCPIVDAMIEMKHGGALSLIHI